MPDSFARRQDLKKEEAACCVRFPPLLRQIYYIFRRKANAVFPVLTFVRHTPYIASTDLYNIIGRVYPKDALPAPCVNEMARCTAMERCRNRKGMVRHLRERPLPDFQGWALCAEGSLPRAKALACFESLRQAAACKSPSKTGKSADAPLSCLQKTNFAPRFPILLLFST